MLHFLARRTIRLLLTLVASAILVFAALRAVPGDPALVLAGIDASAEDVEAMRAALGLDGGVLSQLGDWLGGLLRLDLGTSMVSGESVSSLIAERLPVTGALAVSAMVLSLALALPLGVAAASRDGGPAAAVAAALSQVGMAVPGFWLGILLLLGFAVALPIFPLFGADTPAHFVLPTLGLALGHAAVLLRMTKASILAELGKEYALAARARGESERQVLYGHVLRNALPPVIAIAGVQFGGLLGGAVVMEQVFSIPGLGRLLLTAITQRDFTVVQGCVVCFAAVYSACAWLSDVAAAAANPRIVLR